MKLCEDCGANPCNCDEIVREAIYGNDFPDGDYYEDSRSSIEYDSYYDQD
jgi:hypothetical protein